MQVWYPYMHLRIYTYVRTYIYIYQWLIDKGYIRDLDSVYSVLVVMVVSEPALDGLDELDHSTDHTFYQIQLIFIQP